jgi:hypothetical protein
MNIIKIIINWYKSICEVPLFETILLAVMAICTATFMIRDNLLYRFILYIALWLSMMSILAKERKVKCKQKK